MKTAFIAGSAFLLISTGVSAGEFLGFSSSPVAGDAGYYGMKLACETDFGPDAKMCNSREIIEAKRLTNDGSVTYARVQPYYVPSGTGSGLQIAAVQATDMSGLARFPEYFTCDGYTSISDVITGLAVTGGTFQFETKACNTPYVVACCEASGCITIPD